MGAVSKNRIIKIFSNDNDLFSTAAQDFAEKAIAAVATKNEFNVVLSGGNTPKLFFDALTANPEHRQKIPWRKIKFFFGDERYVPADDPENNYCAAKQHLFSKVMVSAENIFPIPTGFSDPQDSARSYEVTICKVHFDLIYLGLGDDAHTASLMPGTDIVRDYAKGKAPHQLVAALWAPQQKMYRITMTPCAINHSECICFLVTGDNKATAVSHTLEGVFDPERYPAQLIHSADEKIIWYLDQNAAGKINSMSNAHFKLKNFSQSPPLKKGGEGGFLVDGAGFLDAFLFKKSPLIPLFQRGEFVKFLSRTSHAL